ncbi:MAG: flippase-like domain-containing protein [Candidatus Omnitrophica bacterium]|nr:flippase-like domain-containing protein [Candidatus Omnitrophota bacterium]
MEALPAFQYRKPIRGSAVWWLRFLGVAAFLILLLRLPKSQQVQFARLDLRWLGFCMLLTILMLLLESLVWQRLLANQRIRHPYPKTLLSYLASQYLGLVTPGHVGEFLAAGYISTNTGITFGYALSSVVMKKVLAWVAIIGFGIWGLPLIAEMPFKQGVGRLIALGAVALVALSIGIGLWVVSLKRLAHKWASLSPWQIDMTEFWSGMRHLASPRLLIPLALTGLAFSLLFVQLNAVLRAMGIALPFVVVARMMALSRVAARLVPVSLVGFGSKDAALIWLLAQQRVDVVAGIAVALLLLICSYLVTLLLSGVCWWINPLLIRRAARGTGP